jgi:hypothetical protein
MKPVEAMRRASSQDNNSHRNIVPRVVFTPDLQRHETDTVHRGSPVKK